MDYETNSKVANSAEKIQPLLVGMKIPTTSLKSPTSEDINLNELLKNKPTILIFYRGGWCPYCNLHFGKIKEIENDLIKLGYQIIAISPDKPKKLKDTVIKHDIKFILTSDSNMITSKKFGLAFQVDDETIKRYKRYKIDLDDASGENHHLLPVPAIFIIGKDEIIKFSYVNPNYKVRLHPDILMSAAKVFSE